MKMKILRQNTSTICKRTNLQVKKGFIELKDTKLKDREVTYKELFFKPIIVFR